ncbi:uncharacterized protein LOC111350953 [Spodoptera litura]|uniref:Uncharacterized protein LOC111350953 n=1 Tax=Spodoptera litura TaxID=69820 RepID=A0A9J7DXI8_SPOLT|nr:uncharacterized protein LOC111350953 [Spodoptera litura]
MRSFIFITVLSALTACYGASVLPDNNEMITVVYDDEAPNGRIVSDAEFKNSVIIPDNWVLLSEWRCDAPPINNQVQRVGVRYEGDPSIRIGQVSVSYFPPAPHIAYGQLGNYFMEVNITTPVGREVRSTVGMYYRA